MICFACYLTWPVGLTGKRHCANSEPRQLMDDDDVFKNFIMNEIIFLYSFMSGYFTH